MKFPELSNGRMEMALLMQESVRKMTALLGQLVDEEIEPDCIPCLKGTHSSRLTWIRWLREDKVCRRTRRVRHGHLHRCELFRAPMIVLIRKGRIIRFLDEHDQLSASCNCGNDGSDRELPI